MTPFTPKGSVAEWRMIYDRLVLLKPDEVITTAELEEALGRGLGNNRSPIYRATLELERGHHRTLVTVRGVGYRIANPTEHLGLGLEHSARARTNLKRGLERVEATDRSKLDPAVSARLEAFEATTSRLVEFLGRMSLAVDEQGAKINAMEKGVEDTNERVAALEAALRKHGLLTTDS